MKKPKLKPGEVPGKTKMTFYVTNWVMEKIYEHFPSKRYSENVEKAVVEHNKWKKPKEPKVPKA